MYRFSDPTKIITVSNWKQIKLGLDYFFQGGKRIFFLKASNDKKGQRIRKRISKYSKKGTKQHRPMERSVHPWQQAG